MNRLRELIGKARYEKNDRSYSEVDQYLRLHNEHIADLIDAAQDVIRISDRKHDAWDKAKAALAKLEAK